MPQVQALTTSRGAPAIVHAPLQFAGPVALVPVQSVAVQIAAPVHVGHIPPSQLLHPV
jgi:hypothetical protein